MQNRLDLALKAFWEYCMATAEQIKALIRSHIDEDRERFYTLALQVAAHEVAKLESPL
jgi:hypothetical protein